MSNSELKIVLASKSPRRKELLEKIGLKFEIIPSDNEEILSGESPTEIVTNLARDKASEVFGKLDTINNDYLVIGADTIVVYKDKILGKPADYDDAFNTLKMLSGNTHEVITAVCIKTSVLEIAFHEKTEVTFYPLSDDEVNSYLKTCDAFDKAGSYGIQGIFAKHVRSISGDYNNVVGLPVGRLYQELKNTALPIIV